MIKVYQHCLDYLFIIDTDKNIGFFPCLPGIVKDNHDFEKMRITKATVNKHRKTKNNKYAIGKPILSVYAPEELTRYDNEDVDKVYVGEFSNYDEFAVLVKSLIKIMGEDKPWEHIF